MELYHEGCSYARDFEDCCDLPRTWAEPSDDPDSLYQRAYIWFKAYDLLAGPYTSAGKQFSDDGYEFECLVRMRQDTPTIGFVDIDLAHFPARNQEEAERLLQACADAIYEED